MDVSCSHKLEEDQPKQGETWREREGRDIQKEGFWPLPLLAKEKRRLPQKITPSKGHDLPAQRGNWGRGPSTGSPVDGKKKRIW